MDASARMAFNMKVLKRHDPTMEEIIESASFVVLYSHDGEWTKTGIEGPMFLYKRAASPPYGFFVLNRNGVENFSANLTLDDDLELTTEFIIYRASQGEDVVGIWIFEPGQRESVGQQMLKLQATPANAAGAKSAKTSAVSASTSQAGQSISLDALFGGPSKQATVATSSQPAVAPPNGLSLLESIFDSASPSRAAPPTVAPPLPASSLPMDGAEGLKSMLGLQSSQPRSPLTPQGIPARAPPSGLDALFASTGISTPQASKTDGAKAATSNVNGGNTSRPDSAADIVDASLQERTGSQAGGLADSLSRRDFVREVLALIHTDKAFVDDMYQRYLSRSH